MSGASGSAASSWSLYLVFAILPIYWMVNMSLQDQRGDPERLLALCPQRFTWDNYKTHLHRPVLVLGLHQLA